MGAKHRDEFAEIAAQRFRQRDAMLTVPQPPLLDEKQLPLDGLDPNALFRPLEKMETAEQLERELDRMRSRYAPFLQDLAPPVAETRVRLELTDFDWRVETQADAADFGIVLSGSGSWERVSIPHYGPPLGQAVTYYRTVFSLGQQELDRGLLYLVFKGADYKAHVFVNGCYVGSHEGFFAPFELEFTRCAVMGENTLVVKLENDFICMGNSATADANDRIFGDKIYAATGPGYDDPEIGWHHCPPGMGLYQAVSVEARPATFISDVFVRPLPHEGGAEAWVEARSNALRPAPVSFSLSLYGQNFNETVFEDVVFSQPSAAEGVEDGFRDARQRGAGVLDKPQPLLLEKGVNRFKFFIQISDARVWSPETPWLYQLQVGLLSGGARPADAARRQFGMRSFRLDEGTEPKGMFWLNGRPIRLRGANTMGHEQQCVMKKDFGQLVDDIMLAKICNMNFLRLTQRPVQEEVYDYCDRLGLMTQTDLPLFAVLRYNQTLEAVRQAGEMERLVRSHPCNILVTFINEPIPNSWNKPHRWLDRAEMTRFFEAASIAVRLQNPDRIIKPVDGDYDPPAPGLPDNHCYTCWYNGHGIDFGSLHKGFWQPVKEGWNYACGEFGAEGLDPEPLMRKRYPPSWLPQSAEAEAEWSPAHIVRAQTEAFYRFFFERPHTLAGWVNSSQEHQAWAARVMAEAFRRDSRMVSFAIHLFIDAFPSGWMKAIMDVERRPKLAYFAYRDALTPLMANLRADRTKFFSGETVSLEAWVLNDGADAPEGLSLRYMAEWDGGTLLAARSPAEVPVCSSKFQGRIAFRAPEVQARTGATVRLGLVDDAGHVLHDCRLTIEVFPAIRLREGLSCTLPGRGDGVAARLAAEMGLATASGQLSEGLMLIDDYAVYQAERESIHTAVADGMHAVFLELPEGEYEIFGSTVTVKTCGMFPVYFVSRDTGHPLAAGFRPDDFRLWYDPALGRLAPLLDTTVIAPGFAPVLTSGNKDDAGLWQTESAAAQAEYGRGRVTLCQLKLAGRAAANPVARQFAAGLLGLE